MGIGNIGVPQLIILLVVVMLVFGTKKIRNLGGDLGSAIRDFRKGMNETESAVEEAVEDVESDPAAKS
ncbi:MAG: twin-arginine translocase TatA/TatE family subunit [Wenzhouxiangella sp.]|nr:MAG: twin-arginine translocase TatA/TatE family subunit [Wenzhouxiangella sp.]